MVSGPLQRSSTKRHLVGMREAIKRPAQVTSGYGPSRRLAITANVRFRSRQTFFLEPAPRGTLNASWADDHFRQKSLNRVGDNSV